MRYFRHLKNQAIEPILYMTEWFLCVFSRYEGRLPMRKIIITNIIDKAERPPPRYLFDQHIYL